MAKRIERVLIYRLGSLGDLVASLPALHLVERAFPAADRRLLTNFPINNKAAVAEAILGEGGVVGGYFRYPVGSRDLKVLVKLWWQLLRWRPQVVVYLAAARGVAVAKRDLQFFRACGLPRVVGVPLTEDMQTNRVEGEQLEPEYARLARNLSELGDARVDDPASWDLRLTATEHACAEEALRPAQGRPVIAFSVGTKLQANDWEAANWRELLGRLGQMYPGHALCFTGVPGESEASEAAAEGWRAVSGGPVINLCGKLSPRESAACFARAKLFVGHDSGPMHLAASVGTPVVGIFSSRNPPGMWFPWGKTSSVIYHRVDCMQCGLEVCTVERKKCILGISVDEVVGKIVGLVGI